MVSIVGYAVSWGGCETKQHMDTWRHNPLALLEAIWFLSDTHRCTHTDKETACVSNNTVTCDVNSSSHQPGRLYVVMLLSLVPLPLLQQLMLQSLWLAHALGQLSGSHSWFRGSPMLRRPGLQQGGPQNCQSKPAVFINHQRGEQWVGASSSSSTAGRHLPLVSLWWQCISSACLHVIQRDKNITHLPALHTDSPLWYATAKRHRETLNLDELSKRGSAKGRETYERQGESLSTNLKSKVYSHTSIHRAQSLTVWFNLYEDNTNNCLCL